MHFGPETLFNVAVVLYVVLHAFFSSHHISAIFCSVYKGLDIVIEHVFHYLGSQVADLAQPVGNIESVLILYLLYNNFLVGAELAFL